MLGEILPLPGEKEGEGGTPVHRFINFGIS